MKFHAVMLDETGCEFGVDLECDTRDNAYAALKNMYEESRCVQLESDDDTREREARMYDHINRGGDWDDEGFPIFHYDYDDDDDDDDDGEAQELQRAERHGL